MNEIVNTADIADDWMDFLKQQGAHVTDSSTPEVLHFGTGDAAGSGLTDFVAPLADLGLISVAGEDAASFLHNQLTNDVERLGLAEARLAGYCSPKGRLLATFLMWRSPGAVLLQLPRQIQGAVQKRLQMFVLRSKAKLTDASGQYAILGLAGAAAETVLRRLFTALPPTPYAKVDSDKGTLIRVADASGAPRYQWITTAEIAKNTWPELTRALPPVGSSIWKLSEIRAGIPQITQATQEQFVPQMVNFEAIGGVSFKKGCYPGQEIVARSQYLGKLKRRMMLASVASANVQAGMEVFSSADPEQPCGMVVNAEQYAPGQADCLVEIKTAAMEDGTVHLASASGPALQFKPLPYALPDPA
jgi:folate-binding protein YgfZ